jgi:hypothetical protein
LKGIINSSGKAQHGKTSTALFLQKKLPGKSLIIHHADYLKFICQKYLGWNGEKDDYGRTLLQTIGTEKIRMKYKNTFWVDRTCDLIDIFKNDYAWFLIPDCRFRDEIYTTMARFPDYVTNIKVVRLNFDNGLSEEQKNHQSEIDLDNFNFDYHIVSESGLDNLEKQVNIFIEELLKQ